MAPIARSFAEPLMIDLTCVPATQNPTSPRMVCTTTMVVVTAATDGGLLSPLRESAMRGANAQNGTIHRRMRNTPTRRRNGEMPADFASSVDDPSPMQIPGSIKGAPARALALHGGGGPVGKRIRPPGADHGLPHRGEPGPDGARTPFRQARPKTSVRSGANLGARLERPACMYPYSLGRREARQRGCRQVGKGIDVVDGQSPDSQNVNSSGEDIDLCEAPLDDSLEPRLLVIGRCRRSES